MCGEDFSTDGKWCYIVLWVIGKPNTRWNLLKKRLLEVCPSYFSTSRIYYYRPENQQPKPPDVFYLQFWCSHYRKGLLHGNLSFSFFFLNPESSLSWKESFLFFDFTSFLSFYVISYFTMYIYIYLSGYFTPWNLKLEDYRKIISEESSSWALAETNMIWLLLNG